MLFLVKITNELIYWTWHMEGMVFREWIKSGYYLFGQSFWYIEHKILQLALSLIQFSINWLLFCKHLKLCLFGIPEIGFINNLFGRAFGRVSHIFRLPTKDFALAPLVENFLLTKQSINNWVEQWFKPVYFGILNQPQLFL